MITLCLHPIFSRGRRCDFSGTVALGLLIGLSGAQFQAYAYNEQGRVGDAASWRTGEFKTDWGLAAIGAEYAYSRGLSGSGVRVGIFDSGVAFAHPEFAGKNHLGIRLADRGCRSGARLTGNGSCFFADGDTASVNYVALPDGFDGELDRQLADDELTQEGYDRIRSSLGGRYNFHGTHVAGTIAANRDNKAMHGVAFGADLSAVRHFSNTYTESMGSDGQWVRLSNPQSDSVTSAYARLNEQGVRVVNHSWTFVKAHSQTLQELDAALERARRTPATTQPVSHFGLLHVWGAGNVDVVHTSPQAAPFPGVLASLPRMDANLEPYWLSVVNVDRELTLSSTSYRCGHTKDWCVAAPGTEITSAFITGDVSVQTLLDEDEDVAGFDITEERKRFDYVAASGTSMAAPHVSGALALLMERFPYLDNPQVRDVLLTTATDLGEPGIDDVYGWGLVNLEKAVDGPGLLRVDTRVRMDRPAGGTKPWQGGAWDDWRNDIGGDGRLEKYGAGWLRLSGDNSFAGVTLKEGILELSGNNRLTDAVNVEGGELQLNGVLQGSDLNLSGGVAQVTGRHSDATVRVGAGAMLSGDGVLSTTWVHGTISPGSAQRGLTVEGDYGQAAGSALIVGLDTPSRPIGLNVSGQARLEGGALRLVRQAGVYPLGQRYPVLQAAGGINGEFALIDQRAFSPFLSFKQVREAQVLSVEAGRGLLLASAARTRNQHAVASAADRQSLSTILPQRLTSLFPEQAPQALDQLSGQLHASTQSVLIENSRILRDASLARQGVRRQLGMSGTDVWVQLPRQSGVLASDGNAVRVAQNSSGLLLGVDHDLEQGSRLGLVVGSSRSEVSAGSAGKAGINTYQLGVHGGHTWGGVGLSGGAGYAWHQIEARRRVSFPGVEERLTAGYSARTLQVFTEVNYLFDHGSAWSWQPYLQLARIRQSAAPLAERGGNAALHGQALRQEMNVATGGVRATLDLEQVRTGLSWLSLSGGLAYARAGGDLRSTGQMMWEGGSVFEVKTSPLARTSARFDLGARARLSRDSDLQLAFSRQQSDRSSSPSVTAQYSLRF